MKRSFSLFLGVLSTAGAGLCLLGLSREIDHPNWSTVALYGVLLAWNSWSMYRNFFPARQLTA